MKHGPLPPRQLRLNLGGEAEIPEVINQQPQWADLSDVTSRGSIPLRQALQAREAFLFCDNRTLPFPDESVDAIMTNGVPIDITTWLGPGVQTGEIKRVLRSGGMWHDNGLLVFTKP